MKNTLASRHIAAAAAFAWMLPSFAGCQGDIGTINVELVTAPGDDILDGVQRIRLTLSDPLTVVESERTGGGFDLNFEVSAKGQNSLILFEGFDASGALVARGRTPPLPIAAVDATVRVFAAPPRSVRQSPTSFNTARSAVGSARLTFGAIYVGGREDGGDVIDDVVIYNAFDHRFQQGEPLPEPRAAASVMTASFGQVLIFGGDDTSGTASSVAWRFDTNVPPAGAYLSMLTDNSFARTAANTVAIDNDAFLILGDPPLLANALNSSIKAISNVEPIDGAAASVLFNDTVYTLITGQGAGVTGATLFVGLGFTPLASAPAEIDRVGHAAVVLPGGDILVVAGETGGGFEASAVRFNVATRVFTVINDVLQTPRRDAAVAATSEILVVAGGVDATGRIVPDVEIVNAVTLSHLATVPMVVGRSGASAQPLPNGQVIIAGGVDSAGLPTDVIELVSP